MLGSQVASDLELGAISEAVPTLLPWGAHAFQTQLLDVTSDVKKLKETQLPFAALKARPELNFTLRKILEPLISEANAVDNAISLENAENELQSESIGMIFFSKNAQARFLNTNNLYLNLVLFWKTILLPGFALIAPIIGILVPFFIFKLFGKPMSIPDYILHVRGTILKQMSVPSFLKARYEGDRLGGFFEMLFVGGALIMFISGIWNQVNGARHLRSIWYILEEYGSAVNKLVAGAQNILDILKNTSGASKRAFASIISSGEAALTGCKTLLGKSNIVCCGSLLNDPSAFEALRTWFGRIDMITAIATLPVCIVKYSKTPCIRIKGLVHPLLKSCIPNNYDSAGHSILTGPNRGGKSTFCKSLGLSLITAQSMGFAWASEMTLAPFGAIHTALEPAGKLGYASTFEAEIVFAKSVLGVTDRPMFVMMDEIFHSTNAVDGLRASGVFMEALYNKQDCISLISTHYRELASKFGDRCGIYQMIADEKDGQLLYSYKIGAGVSEKSSVDELLRLHGLL